MISGLRRGIKRYSSILYILLIALAVPTGIGIFFSSPFSHKKPQVATVNGRPVLAEDYYKSLSELQQHITMIKQYARSYGISEEIFLHSILGNKNPQQVALDRSIDNALSDKIVQDFSVSIDQDLFKEMLIKEIPQEVIDNNGTIDIGAYRAFLDRMSMSPKQFEASKEQEFLRRPILDMLARGYYITDATVDEAYDKDNQKKQFAFIRIPYKKFLKKAQANEPTDDQLANFYGRTKEVYRVAEERSVNIWSINSKAYAKQLTIDDAAVKNFYEKNKGSTFRVPPQVKVRTLVIDAATTQDASVTDLVKQATEAPETFEKLVKKHSIDKETRDNGGVIDFFSRGTFSSREFEKEAFRLKDKGQISNPIKTDKGIEILQLVERIPAQEKPLEEVRQEIITTLQAKKSINDLRGSIEQALHKSKKGDSEAIKRFLVEKNLDTVTRVERYSADDVSAQGVRGLLAQKIFAAKKDVPYGYLSHEATFHLFQITAFDKSFIQPLEKVQAKVKEEYCAEQALTNLRDEAKRICQALLDKKSSLQEISSSDDYTLETTDLVDKKDSIKKLSDVQNASGTLFGLTDKTQTCTLVSSSKDILVAQLIDQQPSAESAENIANEKNKIRDRDLSRNRSAFVNAVIASLRKLATIEINEVIRNQQTTAV